MPKTVSGWAVMFALLLFVSVPWAAGQAAPGKRSPGETPAAEKVALNVTDPKWSLDDVLMMERARDVRTLARWTLGCLGEIRR